MANSYEYGDTIHIEWSTNNSVLPVTLDYSTDGGITWSKIVTVRGENSYDWAVPSIPSQQYRLRASVSDTSFYWNVVDTLNASGFWTIGAYFINDSTLITLDGSDGAEDSLRVWDMKTGGVTMVAPVLHESETESDPGASTVAVSTYSDHIVSGASNVTRCYLRTLKNSAVVEFMPGTIRSTMSQQIFDDIFRPNGSSLLTVFPHHLTRSEWMIAEYGYNPVERVMILATGYEHRSVDFVSFLPSGHILAIYKPTQNGISKCRLFDEYTGDMVAESVQEVKALDVWYSEDGEKIAIPSQVGGTYIFDANDLSLIRQLQTHSGSIMRSAFSPDGKYLLVLGGNAFTANLLDIAISRVVQMPELPSLVKEVAFSPDSKLAILGCQNGDIASFDVATGDLVWHKRGAHSGAIQDIVFSPNREYAITTSSDGVIYVWHTSMAIDYTHSNITIEAPAIRTIPVVFGNVPVGMFEEKTTVALNNESAIDLKIESYILHGPASAEFELIDDAVPFTVNAHSSRQITVRFTPQNSSIKRAWIEYAVPGRYTPTVVDLMGNMPTSGIESHRIYDNRILARFQSEYDMILQYTGDRTGTITVKGYDLLGRQYFNREIDLSPGSSYHILFDRAIVPGQYLLVVQDGTQIVSLPLVFIGT